MILMFRYTSLKIDNKSKCKRGGCKAGSFVVGFLCCEASLFQIAARRDPSVIFAIGFNKQTRIIKLNGVRYDCLALLIFVCL